MSITSQVPNTKTQVDWFIFGAGLFILVSISLTIVLAPQWSASAIATANKFVTNELGIVYIIAAIAVLIFLLGIALSKHGDIVLGNQNVPEHSMFSWASMLFCAGMGASLIYWAAAEWTFY
jgi:BCCT family betaine/carnitine transporter